MSNVRRDDRSDGTEIRKLAHLGFGLKKIAEMVGCHAATVSVRLKDMGIAPTDTRRNFSEKVCGALLHEELEWLATVLYNSGESIESFLTVLVKQAYAARPPEPVAQLPALPTTSVTDSVLQDTIIHGTGVSTVDKTGRDTYIHYPDLFPDSK